MLGTYALLPARPRWGTAAATMDGTNWWTVRLTPAITAVSAALRAAGLSPEVGPMSTIVTGDATAIFDALQAAFMQAGALGHVVMTVTVSNACPV
jgi:uncharacterized protein YqgV (UPF0045/DUF77 family)